MKFFGRLMLFVCAGFPAVLDSAHAVQSKSVRDDATEILSQGTLESVALTSDGYLSPGYERKTIGPTGAEIIWDTLQERSGSVLCATGHGGRLMRVIDENTSKTLATLPEPELTALVEMGDGSVLVAAAPSGTLYRLATDDTLTTFGQIAATFVWRMQRDSNGDIWAVTGTEGKLFRIREKAGAADIEEVFAFKSKNLLSMWIDEAGDMGEKGDIYVGGQAPGWLYRYRPSAKKAEVVYNPSAEEIRALLPDGNGLIMALNTERAPTAKALSLTLRMTGGAPGGAEGSPAPAGPPAPAPDPRRNINDAFAPGEDARSGGPRSEIVILNHSGFTRTLWTSPERPISDIARSPQNQLLAAVGSEGHLYEIKFSGESALVADLREQYIVRLAPGKDDALLLGAASDGVVFALEPRPAAKAVYLSRAIDGGAAVNWGRFYAHGELNKGDEISAAFRTGNDGDTESDFWSEWTGDKDIKIGEPLPAPAGPARYLQYRLTLKQAKLDERPMRIDYTEAFFIEPNAAPEVTSITVSEAPAGKGPKPPAAPPAASPSPAPPGPGKPPSAPGGPADGNATPAGEDPHSNSMTLNIAWQARDPNADPMQFALFFRAEDENEWKLIDDELQAPTLPLSIGGVADGRYRFKVIATDAPGNPPREQMVGQKISEEVIVDNTAPVFTKLEAKTNGAEATIEIELEDEVSLLGALKVDVDNGDTFPLLPEDGLIDQKRERFIFKTGELSPGEHVATFNATDHNGNTAVRKVVFNTGPSKRKNEDKPEDVPE